MIKYRIEVHGKPIAKKRPRFVHKDKKGNPLPYVKTINPQETEEGRFMWKVMEQLQKGGHFLMINEGPVALGLTFIMPVTKNWPKYKLRDLKRGVIFYHHSRPDLDNLIKFVKDCLSGMVYRDDNQVALMREPQKIYGLEPKTIIEVEQL